MKNVLITGASRGIGLETAKKFAREGHNVILNYNKSEECALRAKTEIESTGGVCLTVKADVARCEAVKAMFEKINTELGGIDVLVNNAGIALPQGLFTDFDEADCRRVFDVNVYGMMNCCREAIPGFVKKKRGKIINLSSIWGIGGGSCEVVYSASKAAVIGFTKALAREMAPSGINVNCVAPGMIATDMNSHLTAEDTEAFRLEIPLQKIGEPKDIAGVICFLASDAADYITGQVVTVDGGLM